MMVVVGDASRRYTDDSARNVLSWNGEGPAGTLFFWYVGHFLWRGLHVCCRNISRGILYFYPLTFYECWLMTIDTTKQLVVLCAFHILVYSWRPDCVSSSHSSLDPTSQSYCVRCDTPQPFFAMDPLWHQFPSNVVGWIRRRRWSHTMRQVQAVTSSIGAP